MRRTLWVLFGAAALFSASSSVVFALLGNLQDEYGFSDAGLGMIAASGFLASFVTQLFIAPLADRRPPKQLLMAGAAISLAGNVAFAASTSLWGLIAARALIGTALGCFLPAARALVASLGEVGRGERLGKMGSAEVGGFVMGPVIGGLLVGPLGVRVPFLLFAGLAAVTLALLAVTPLPTLARSPTSSRLALDLLALAQVRVAVLIAVALALPIGMYEALWDRYLTDLGASDLLVGVSLAAFGIPFVLLAAYGGRLADRVGAMHLLTRALMIIVPLTALYGWFSSPWVPITLGVAEAVVQAGANPAAQTVVAQSAPPGRAAAAQGLAGATTVLTAAVVALVASTLYGAFGPEVVFTTVAAASGSCALMAWRLSRRAPTPATDVVANLPG
jgi:MFS family permease